MKEGVYFVKVRRENKIIKVINIKNIRGMR